MPLLKRQHTSALQHKTVTGGNPTGLYHFAVGDGQNVFMGNGLGGTSLLNANVFLEATPAVLEMDIWPDELKGVKAWTKCKPYGFPYSSSVRIMSRISPAPTRLS
jgi:hypothetical protein